MAVTAQVNVKIDSAQASKTVGQLNQDVSNAAKSASSLKAELRQTIQELQNLQPGTARFQELSARAGELRDQIADTNAVVGQLAGNVTERLTRGITNVVSIGVAGFQTLAAGAALFGTENEELNETLIRLNALMNLSQAVETFAGLDQKLVEIRASFQSLTTATAVQTVAMEGEAVATTSATVATTALGTAMKALPIIALVAGLATLAYGLYQYATASSEADKNEKRRKANLEALKKAEKEQTETIAKESAEYVGLIYQLKATNADSKERETLIKQINATYGTTLKNLSDEKAFQQQLNLEVANYIAFQKANDENKEIIPFKSEKDLLSGFIDLWIKLDPTIISGWNSEFFDIPYLYYRIRKVLSEDMAQFLSPIKKVKSTNIFDAGNMVEYVGIGGINHLDYMNLFKKFITKQEPSYALGNIGEKYVKLGKVEYKPALGLSNGI